MFCHVLGAKTWLLFIWDGLDYTEEKQPVICPLGMNDPLTTLPLHLGLPFLYHFILFYLHYHQFGWTVYFRIFFGLLVLFSYPSPTVITTFLPLKNNLIDILRILNCRNPIKWILALRLSITADILQILSSISWCRYKRSMIILEVDAFCITWCIS